MSRSARVVRATSESEVVVELELDGTGRLDRLDRRAASTTTCSRAWPSTRCSTSTCRRRATSTSTRTTPSRTSRSCSAQALREALGDKAGIRRFGDALVPLDEALVQAAVDVSGRPYCVHTGEPAGQEHVVIGGSYVGSLTRHVFETLAHAARHRPARPRALRPRPAPRRRGAVQGGRPRPACRRRARPRAGGAVPSTKGTL